MRTLHWVPTVAAMLACTACFERGVVLATPTLQVNPASVPADGTSEAQITLSLGNAPIVEPTSFSFASSDANAVFTQPTESGRNSYVGAVRSTSSGLQTISAYVFDGSHTERLQPTAQVDFTAPGDPNTPNASRSVLTAMPGTVTADGVDSTTLTLTLRNYAGIPLVGHAVLWDASGTQNIFGATSGVTDNDGVATTSLQSAHAETKRVSAMVDGVEVTANVRFLAGAANSIAAIVNGTAVADGTSTVTVSVSVIDAQGNPVAGAPVDVGASDANTTVFPTTGYCDADGQFSVTVSSTAVGTHNVNIASGSASTSQAVGFVAGPPSLAKSSLTASPTSLVADGAVTSALTAIVEDTWGHPVAYALVSIGATGTSNTFTPATGATDANGQFVTAMASAHAEAKTVTLTVLGVNLSAQVTFVAGSADSTQSTLTANPTSVIADGSTKTLLSITALDAAGNAAAGRTVTLSSTGAGNTFTSSSGVTDASGHWTAQMASTAAEVKLVTATVDGVNVSTNVTFTAGTANNSTTTLVAAPSTVTADGTSFTVLKVTVLDAQGNAVSGQNVTFASTGSALVWTPVSAQAATDASGVATVRLASTVAESKPITASTNGFTKTASVLFTPSTPSSGTSKLTANPNSLLADGTSASTIVVTVTDGANNPVNSQAVTFSASGVGYTFSQTSGSTGSNGQLTTTLVSTVAENKVVTATFAGVSVNANVLFNAGVPSPLTSSLTVTPSSLLADGVTHSALALLVKDPKGNVVPSQAVTFTASGTGYTITPSSGVTLSNGVFNANMVATKAEVKSVTATAGSVIATANVTFTTGTASSTTTTFVANPNVVAADGASTSTLTARVFDGQNNPVVGLSVVLSAPGGTNVWAPASSGSTDSNGVFTATLASSTRGTQTVTANIGAGAISKTADVNFTTPLVSTVNSTFVASPTTLTANGAASTTLTATVRDATNTPVIGQTVTLGSTGSAYTFTPPSGTTNGSGIFTATMNSTKAEAKTVSALVDGTTLNAAVTFTAGPAVQGNTTLVASPNSLTADGASNSNVTITVGDAFGNPVQGQVVTFGYGGSVYTLSPTSGSTGPLGTLTATLTSTLAQNQNVSAAVGSAFTFITPVAFVAGAPSSPNSTLVAAPTSLTADGNTRSVLTFTVRDAHGNPAGGQTVTLNSTGTNYVFTPPSGSTDASGVFNANMTSTKAEVKVVSATSGSASKTANVTFTAGAPSTVTSQLVASPNSLTANGTASSTLTFTLEDAQNNPIVGQAVHLSSNGNANVFGNPNGTTDPNGQYTTTLTSTKAETKTLTAVSDGVTETVNVVFNPGNPNATASTLTASPTSVTANGSSISALTVTVRDAQSNVISGQAVTFSSTGTSNTISPTTGTTGVAGTVTVSMASTVAESKTASVSFAGVGTSAALTFVPGPPSSVTSTLVASPTSVTADGSTVTTLALTARDANNNLIKSEPVTLTSTGSSNAFGSASGSTNTSGQYVTTLTSTHAEAKTVTANMGGVASVTASVTFVPGPINLATSTFTSSDSSAPADGATAIGLTVSLRDAQGNPITGTHVVLTATGGTGYVFTPANGNTVTGTFTSTIKSSNVETLTLTATFGAQTLTTAVSFNPLRCAYTSGVPALRLPGAGTGNAASVGTADLNGDSKLDIAAVSNNPNQLVVYLNNGAGYFEVPYTYPVVSNPLDVALGDFNADGIIDAAVVSDSSVSVLLGTGFGHFATATSFSAGISSINAMIALDIDSDGDLDLVLAGGGTTGGAAVLLGTGAGTFGAATLYTTGNNPMGVAKGDFNGDSRPDLAVANNGGNTVSILLGKSGGGFNPAVSYAAGNQTYGVAVADLNGDGHVDVATANAGGNTVSVFLGTGTGTLGTATTTATGVTPHGIAIADTNADGKLDVVTSNNLASSVSVLRGTGTGALGAATNYGVTRYPHNVVLADVTADGRPDILTANGDGTVSIVASLSSGAFAFPDQYVVAAGSATGVTAADFTGDGKIDFAAANSSATTMSTWLGLGTGVFSAVRYSTVGGSTVAMASGDINADSKVDIVVTASGVGSVYTMFGAGNGNFTLGSSYPVDTCPAEVVLANVDGNPNRDILTVSACSATVSVLSGKGSGLYSAAVSYTIGTNGQSLATADFNGDGRNDVAVSLVASNAVGVLLNTAAYTFAPVTTTAVGATPYGIVVADFNGDGKQDVASANTTDATVSILLGKGNGTFQTQVTYPTMSRPIRMRAGDFNGDGIVDIVVSCNFSNAMGVLAGKGDGTFTPTFYLAGTATPNLFDVGDFDGNGITDIAACTYTTTCAVMLGAACTR